jgi:Poly(R)-hydroxyalkanoic acid synthase subunit (PHA_synth_III_E)
MNSSDHQPETPDYFRQFADPWRAMTEMWASWSEASQAAFKERGEKAGELLTRAWNPEFWRAGELAPFIEELQEIFSLPRLADVPNVDFSAFKPAASMFELAKFYQQYLAVSIPLWVRISQRFQAELAEREKSGEPVKSPGAALDLWNSAVDGTLMEFTRSGEFGDIQQGLLRAAAHYRLQLRAIGERSARAFDMPTRSEMTDLYQRLHDMRKEVHQLRREVRALRGNGNYKSSNAARSTQDDEDRHDVRPD